MTLSRIKQSLHQYLEMANEKKIKAIYTMVEADIKSSVMEFSDDLKVELDQRQKDYNSGKSKLISSKESKKRIDKLLNSKLK